MIFEKRNGAAFVGQPRSFFRRSLLLCFDLLGLGCPNQNQVLDVYNENQKGNQNNDDPIQANHLNGNLPRISH
jgi:hypothetical protein